MATKKRKHPPRGGEAVGMKRCMGLMLCKSEGISDNRDLIGEVVPSMEECLPCPTCKGKHGTIIMQMHAGSAAEGRYELGHGFGNTVAVVRDTKSGREFRLGWAELVGLAINRGINGGPFLNRPKEAAHG